jgi:hypothetical protein
MSARHLSRTASFDPFVSDHYFQLCLEKLIPALNDHEVTMDDDLLAATVILRLLEEYDGEKFIFLSHCRNSIDKYYSSLGGFGPSRPFLWN